MPGGSQTQGRRIEWCEVGVRWGEVNLDFTQQGNRGSGGHVVVGLPNT